MTRHVPEHELELYREEDAYVVIAEMDEIERDEIQVTWKDGRLHVSAEHVDPDTGRTRVVSKSMTFNREVLPEEITAEYREGVLEVRVPIGGEKQRRGLDIEVD